MKERDSSLRVKYEEGFNGPQSPIVININEERLKQLLIIDAGLTPNQVGSLIFNITYSKLPQETRILLTEEGMAVQRSLIGGSTHISRDNEGQRLIEIHTRPTSERFITIKNALLEYAVLTKYENLPSHLAERLLSVEQAIAQDFATQKLPRYLRLVDWERAAKFLDKLLRPRLAKEIVRTFLHEVAHIKDAEVAEHFRARTARKEKIARFASLLMVLPLGGAVGGSLLTGNPELLWVGWAWIIPGVSSLYLSRGVTKDRQFYRKMEEETERKAREASAPSEVAKWSDLVEITLIPIIKNR